MEWEFHSREWNPVDFPKPGLETSTLGLGVRLSDEIAMPFSPSQSAMLIGAHSVLKPHAVS